MSDSELFALVRLPPSGPARETLLRDYEAIAYGGSDEMLRKFFACEAVERDLANQQQQTAETANRVADIGTHFMDQLEALTVRQDKQRRLDAKRKADQERQAAENAARAEAAAIRDYLATHPESGASADESPVAGGELHPHAPIDKEHLDPEAETDAEGVPLSYPPIPTSYIRGTRDQTGDLPEGVERRSPAPLGSDPVYDPAELGRAKDPKQVPQPTAVSLW
jgi:hypothetical protein